MEAVGTLLKRAREAAGLTQAELGEAAGTSQPNIAAYESGRLEPRLDTLARLIEACGADMDITITPKVRRGAEPLVELASEMAADMSTHGPRDVFRGAIQFVDDARGSSRVGVDALIADRPEATGDVRVDALVAALAEFVASETGIPIPGWTSESGRSAEPWWFVADIPGLQGVALHESPASFSRHGIFIGKDAFDSV